MRSILLFLACLFVITFCLNCVNCFSSNETLDIFAGAKHLPETRRESVIAAGALAEADLDEASEISTVLSPHLLVRILALLPAGTEYEKLYVTIGGKLGELVYNTMSPHQQWQIRIFLDGSGGLGLGQKIGVCFATRGFLAEEKNNLMTGIIGSFAADKVSEITKEQVEEMIKTFHVEAKYGHGFAAMIRDFSNQLAPYIANKLLHCILGPNERPANLPANVKLSDILTVLPHGEKYNRIYQFIGHIIGQEAAQEIMKGKMLAAKATSVGAWVGQSVGKCVALYGWKVEEKSNMLINLFMRIMRSKRVTAFLRKELDGMISRYHLTQFGPDAVKVIQTVGMSLSATAAERFLQCLLLPISQRGRDYKLIPFAQLQQTELSGRRSSSEAELDSFSPRHLMHNRDLHRLQRRIAVSVSVEI